MFVDRAVRNNGDCERRVGRRGLWAPVFLAHVRPKIEHTVLRLVEIHDLEVVWVDRKGIVGLGIAYILIYSRHAEDVRGGRLTWCVVLR